MQWVPPSPGHLWRGGTVGVGVHGDGVEGVQVYVHICGMGYLASPSPLTHTLCQMLPWKEKLLKIPVHLEAQLNQCPLLAIVLKTETNISVPALRSGHRSRRSTLLPFCSQRPPGVTIFLISDTTSAFNLCFFLQRFISFSHL